MSQKIEIPIVQQPGQEPEQKLAQRVMGGDAKALAEAVRGQQESAPASKNDLQRQIDELRAVVGELETQNAALRESANVARLKQTRDEANAPSRKIGNGAQDAAIDRAVQVSGGNAKFWSLSLDRRLAAIGEAPATEKEIEQSRQFFGKGASSYEASNLGKNAPKRYARLRAVAKMARIF